MTSEKAWDILGSYCVGNRKYSTPDTVAALSWALNELDRVGKGTITGEKKAEISSCNQITVLPS